MPLIVEDGTAPANANSFATLAFIRSYASDRGIDLSVVGGTTDAALTAIAIKATDYLESLAKRYVGQPNSPNQSLSWPRANVLNFDGSSFPNTGAGSIPVPLQCAEAQLCIEQNNGVVLMPTTDFNNAGGFVLREKTDVLETTFSERIGTTKEPLMPIVERWLQTLVTPRPGGLVAVRV